MTAPQFTMLSTLAEPGATCKLSSSPAWLENLPGWLDTSIGKAIVGQWQCITTLLLHCALLVHTMVEAGHHGQPLPWLAMAMMASLYTGCTYMRC